jgi:hypothetical protein
MHKAACSDVTAYCTTITATYILRVRRGSVMVVLKSLYSTLHYFNFSMALFLDVNKSLPFIIRVRVLPIRQPPNKGN